MHVLGLCCGSEHGNSEILLKVALKAAQAKVPGTTVSLIKVAKLSIPSFPMSNTFDPARGGEAVGSVAKLAKDNIPDDRQKCLDEILNADAIIVSSPIYTRQPPGVFKYFCDKTLGPFVDVALITKALEEKAAGNARFADIKPDMRIMKPRVAGLIAVGGASSSEWTTFGLPLLNQSMFSFHAKIVDQVQVLRCPFPGSVLFKDEQDVISRAQKLGQNIASQLGLEFGKAAYLGEPGICPYCHLDMVVLHKTYDNSVDCAVCGAKGRLVTGDDGRVTLAVDESQKTSIITMAGKQRHGDEIALNGKALGPRLQSLRPQRDVYNQMDEELEVKMPSYSARSVST